MGLPERNFQPIDRCTFDSNELGGRSKGVFIGFGVVWGHCYRTSLAPNNRPRGSISKNLISLIKTTAKKSTSKFMNLSLS